MSKKEFIERVEGLVTRTNKNYLEMAMEAITKEILDDGFDRDDVLEYFAYISDRVAFGKHRDPEPEPISLNSNQKVKLLTKLYNEGILFELTEDPDENYLTIISDNMEKFDLHEFYLEKFNLHEFYLDEFNETMKLLMYEWRGEPWENLEL